MGDYVNYIIDNLVSVSWRLMELPLYLLLIFLFIFLLLVNLILKKKLQSRGKKAVFLLNMLIIIFAMAFILDKKFSNLKSDITTINEKLLNTQLNTSNEISYSSKVDLDSFHKEFSDCKVFERPINEAITLLSARKNEPIAAFFIAIIELEHPGLEVKITPEFKEKYRTSVFAKENECILAINGEAGESMALDCELGEWSGNWVSSGKAIMMADSEKRPFMGFTRSNKVSYSKESILDTIQGPDKYNAIWGRHDILVDGIVLEDIESKPYARTIMGSNKEGTKLYLMIVDGKRPDYSLGLTYEKCAKMLKKLGADNAMACDQGGSSCMYIETMGGLVNRPADSDGYERKIYSHFGISMK